MEGIKPQKAVMLDTKTIGNKISTARKKINITQAQLAELLFISPQAVGKWERGESSPDIITFNRLAEILIVDLNYFSENFQAAEVLTTSKTSHKNIVNIERAAGESVNLASSQERQALLNLNAVNLRDSDFAGAVLPGAKFSASQLCRANFSGANLTASLFEASEIHWANFDGANLTDCTFSVSDLKKATFCKSILVRTNLNKSSMDGTIFTEVNLSDAKFSMTDLRKTIFVNCTFSGVDFRQSDLRGMQFNGHTFVGVCFDKSALSGASFTGSTLKNVSFRLPFSLTNKSHVDFKTVCFDGATMDKQTYAALKGLMVADLSKVKVI